MRKIVGPSLDLTSYSYKNKQDGAGKIISSVAKDFGTNSIDRGDNKEILGPTNVCPSVVVYGLLIDGLEQQIKGSDEDTHLKVAKALRAADALTDKLCNQIGDTIKSMEEGPEIEVKENTVDKGQDGPKRVIDTLIR